MLEIYRRLVALYRRFNPWHSMLICMVILATVGMIRFGINEFLDTP